MNKLNLIGYLACMLFSVNSLAQQEILSGESFKQEIAQFSLACDMISCKNSDYSVVQVYKNPNIVGDLSKKTKFDLIQIAKVQAQVWGDTILEGEYHSSGHTSLDTIEKLFNKNTFIGFRIRYSEKAWYLGDCAYDYENEETLKECAPGRIRESSFVSPDLKDYFVNEEDYAEFYD